MNKQKNEKVLIVGPSWVGDMVMAQSLFISLKQQNPNSSISVIAPPWTRPLLDRMPEVDEGIDISIAHGELKWAERRAIGKSLRSSGFTSSIVLPNSLKSALIPYHAKIRNRTAWRGEWRNLLLTDCRALDKEAFPRMVDRFVGLAHPVSKTPPENIPRPRLSINHENVDKVLERFRLTKGLRTVAICPGAEFGKAKQWPAEHYGAVCAQLISEGWRVWVFGSTNDSPAAQNLLAFIPRASASEVNDLTGKTSLAEAIDLMSVADAVISNDSGLMHIGAALDKLIIAIYGSTSPEFTPPLSDRVKLMFTDIECRPCFKRECPYGHLRCLKDLEPSRVLDAARGLIEP
jgi:heptosyltransferase-2